MTRDILQLREALLDLTGVLNRPQPDAALIALATIASPLARQYYFVWLLFPVTVLVRRAAGHDQRSGVMGRIFAVTAVVCALIFLLWFLVIHGPGAGLAGPGQNKV